MDLIAKSSKLHLLISSLIKSSVEYMSQTVGVGYIRVSTKEQDEEIQRKSILEFVSKKGINVIQFFIDKGVSGSVPFKERQGAQLLLSFIEREKPNVVIVWSIDRLGRNMMDTISSISLLEEGYGVKVVSVREEWMQTLDENIRKLILSILSWVAEFERRRIRERQLEAWNQGKQKGRPKKVRDDEIEKYLRKYNNLKLRDIWKIMRNDGYDISYSLLRERKKKLMYVWVSGKWMKVTP